MTLINQTTFTKALRADLNSGAAMPATVWLRIFGLAIRYRKPY